MNGESWSELWPAGRRKYPDYDLGIEILLHLYLYSSWALRRIESVHFLDSRSFLRQTSLDCELLASSPVEGRHLIPLALLKKGALKSLDVRDETGGAIPVLTKDENTEVSVSALLASAVIGEDVKSLPTKLIQELRWIVSAESHEARQAIGIFFSRVDSHHPTRMRLLRNRGFVSLLGEMARNFLLLTPTPEDLESRRIFKFSFTEPFVETGMTWRQRLAWEPFDLAFDTPAVDESRSYHFEMTAPIGIDIVKAELVGLNPDGSEELLAEHSSGRTDRAHLYPGHQVHAQDAYARIWVLPSSHGMVRPAFYFSVLVSLLMIALLARLETIRSASEIPSLLLVSSSFIGLFLIRSGEPLVVTKLLFTLRALVVVTTLIPIAGALLLSMALGGCILCWLWAALTMAAVVAAFVLGQAYSVSRG